MQSSAADANPLPQTGKSRWVTRLMFLGVLAGGLASCANQLVGEVAASEEAVPWLLLLIALLIALGFEFGNGFHDTANAVAKVIYTHLLKDAFILLDEAQNTSPVEIKMFLTRVGEGCTTVINGDIAQCDLAQGSGLRIAIERLRARQLPIPVVEFSTDDIVRSGLCAMWVRAFEESGRGAWQM